MNVCCVVCVGCVYVRAAAGINVVVVGDAAVISGVLRVGLRFCCHPTLGSPAVEVH
jgi:hypothetical protein